jgi:hypothetical protein
VMIRPLKAINLIHQKMGAMLQSEQIVLRGVVAAKAAKFSQ